MDFLAQAQALTASAAQGEGRAMRVMRPGASRLPEESRTAENGWGGFLPEGGYAIDVRPGKPTPAPWCWILANDFGGLMITERGGGFFWQGNSRSGRLTPWSNDPLRERWGLMLYLIDDARKQWLRLLPGDVPQMPFRARFDAASARYAFDNERLAGRVDFFMAEDRAEVRIDVQLENRWLPEGDYRLAGCVDWLMGVDAGDLPWVRTWESDGACLASGACGGVGYFASGCAGATAGPDWRDFIGEGTILRPAGFDAPCSGGSHVLNVPLRLRWSEPARIRLALGWAEDARHARLLARALRTGEDWTVERARRRARVLSGELEIETPDPLLNRFAGGFLVHQVRAARVLGRTGYYQPGGAWGFRDQLQDMLTLLHYEPDRVRAHLLRCAACQFEAGDVLHWWHEPLRGVRTRISDDRLFLPWAVATYVVHTGDTAVLSERIP